jgi:hypothetical protein
MNQDFQVPSSDPTPSELQVSRGRPWLRVVLLVLVVGALGAFTWWMVTRADSANPEAAIGQPLATPAPPPTPAREPVDFPAADATLAGAAAKLSARAEVKDWLSSPEALRRVVGAVQLVADGESPRPMLGVLKPAGVFSVEPLAPKSSRLVISPKSYARYDGISQAIGSVDAAEVGRLYAQLRGALESAYADIAPPGKHFEDAFGKAVDRLAAVPLSDQPVEVVPLTQGIGYAFADPALERLTGPEKHLLRMGPANARLIVKQLQAFRAAAMK